MLTIALVGCGKSKAVSDPSGYEEARNLYKGELFLKRVKYVEARSLPWYVLSAKSGLLNPSTPIRMYDRAISELSNIELAEWHLGVANQLMSELWYEFNQPKLSTVSIELHAGSEYCEPLGSILQIFGVKVSKPVEGLGIGQQLAFYKSSLCESQVREGVAG